ncbi:MAG: penicillin-binding protein 2 [Abditibacteriota bacterium]|nr:penicillin-binding protein 2 [Abditibacteriota bacterium]
MRKDPYDFRSKRKPRTIGIDATFIFIIICVMFALLLGRMGWFQLIKRDRNVAAFNDTMMRSRPIKAKRGSVLDRDGNVLAETVARVRVFVNTKQAVEAGTEVKAADVISDLFDIPKDEIVERIRSRKHRIEYFVKDADPEKAELLKKAARRGGLAQALDSKLKSGDPITGLGAETYSVRSYPNDSLASNIIGYVNSNGESIYGIEHKYELELCGNSGWESVGISGSRQIPGSKKVIKECLDGKNVYLTIDKRIQEIAEKAMLPTIETYKPESMCAIVMNPYTGEILALANYPTLNLNEFSGADPEKLRNGAVEFTYEPGSTLKTIVAASALEDGCVEPKEVVATCHKTATIGKHTIHCSVHHPYNNGPGPVDCYMTIDQSCNMGAMALGSRLGDKKLYKYLTDFGLVGKHYFGFGGEGYYPLEDPNKEPWAKIKLANVSFGQGISVTPLQMAAAYCVIANGGEYVRPQIIRGITADDKVPNFSVKEKRRVLSERTAKEVRDMLESCVENGTGKSAKIEGRTIGGKTGSAQASVNGRGYSGDYLISSFIGIAPAEKPELVIAVIVRRPQGNHYGAVVAAPILREIAEESLRYMKIPADKPEAEDTERKESI